VAGTTTITDAVEMLSDLIHTCRATENGFRRGAEAITQTDLRRLLDTYAKQSARFWSQLEVELVRLGGVLDRRDALDGAIAGKTLVRFPVTNPSKVIEDCARMEDELLRGYQNALQAELPPPLQTIIERQLTAILAASGRLRDLRSRHRTVA
jgi:uncharacterized protein (TIGR02284 family)